MPLWKRVLTFLPVQSTFRWDKTNLRSSRSEIIEACVRAFTKILSSFHCLLENVNCEVNTGPPTTTTRPPPPSCEGVSNFRFIPSPFACHEYFQCIEEIAFLVTCPRGLYFSYAIQSCDYPSKNLIILLTCWTLLKLVLCSLCWLCSLNTTGTDYNHISSSSS